MLAFFGRNAAPSERNYPDGRLAVTDPEVR